MAVSTPGRERLGEQLDPLGQLALPGDGLLGVAADVEDPHVRPERPGLLDQLVAAHSRHDHVGEQEVDRGRRCSRSTRERLDAVAASSTR